MHTLKFDSNMANSFDITNYLTSKLADAQNETEVAIDLSEAPANQVKRNLPQILEIIQKSNNIVSLNFSSQELSDDHARQIAVMIQNSPSLKTVSLAHNRIGDTGAIALANAMKAQRAVEILLSHNKIRTHGAQSFVQAAIETGKKEIDLSHNKLLDLGAKAIAEEFKNKETTVEKLMLIGNGINKTGDKFLATSVPKTVKIYHRTEALGAMRTCPQLPYLARIALLPLTYIWSCIMKPVEHPEGCLHQPKGC